MGAPAIVVPHRPDAELRQVAESIIARHHPSRKLPIPVEDIIDVGLHINIFPLPGLIRVLEGDGVIAFVNSPLDTIAVDAGVYDGQTPRYRAAIAHELAHILLHGEVFAMLKIERAADWAQAMKLIPMREYAQLESQADVFAGHLLVPTGELRREFDICLRAIRTAGIDLQDYDAANFIISKVLADSFRVPSGIMRARIDRESLWESTRAPPSSD